MMAAVQKILKNGLRVLQTHIQNKEEAKILFSFLGFFLKVSEIPIDPLYLLPNHINLTKYLIFDGFELFMFWSNVRSKRISGS